MLLVLVQLHGAGRRQNVQRRKHVGCLFRIILNKGNNFLEFISLNQIKTFGSTGSRLLTGNNVINDEFEGFINSLYKKTSLHISSGYMANCLLIETLFNEKDIIFLDKVETIQEKIYMKLSELK